VPEEPGLADVLAGQRELLPRMRAVVEATPQRKTRGTARPGTARARRAGLPKAEPGAGSAGPGVA